MYRAGEIDIAPRQHAQRPKREGFHATLRDGTPVLVRPVQPDDKWRIEDGLTRMSPASVYQRFCRSVARLSENELRYLTEVDQVRHIAWGAVDPEEPSQPGLAVARLIAELDCPARAEVALTVVDSFRGIGLGTLLLATLCVLAQQQGIRTLRACILPENSLMIGWFRRLGAQTAGDEGSDEDSMVTLDLCLTGPFLQRVPAHFADICHRLQAVLGTS